MLKTKSNSVEDLQVQGRSLLGSEVGMTDTLSKKKKKSKRLAGRSKSLTDASSSSKPFFSGDISRNFGKHGQSYLRRIPTQDDIYKILSETSDFRRSTGGSKRLSRYELLPAIGEKVRPAKKSDNEVLKIPDSTSTTSDDDNARKLTREGTYNVLKPKFVKGPIINDSCRNKNGNFKEKKYKEIATESENQLKQSSATIAFGPRLPKEEENITEGEPTATDFTLQLQGNTSAVIPSNTEFKNKKSESLNQVNSVPVQKLYHRGKEQNDSRRLAIALISMSANEGADDKPKVQNALWFD
jgi:hypothetical protein